MMMAALSFVAPVIADTGIDQLNRLSKQLQNFSARFTQTVYDSNSKPVQESSGVVTLQRPGKFSWNYQTPSAQLIVSDGKKIWIYDEELAQVTIKKIDASLGNTPLMLLGSNKPLESEFELTELGQSDGIDWVELSPMKEDTDFEKVYLGLADNNLAAMELRDNFGQATQIKFDDPKLNTDIDQGLFDFIPPEGVDVIGQ